MTDDDPRARAEARAWSTLLDLARRRRDEAARRPVAPPLAGLADAEVLPAQALLDLLRPFAEASPGRTYVLAHLGQSLDGQIATAAGDSHYVNGAENLVHLHRLRALADAVVVGVGTVVADDPRLTTRRVPGPSPVRVVLDPRARLGPDRRVLCDGAAPTLVVRPPGGPRAPGDAETIEVPVHDGRLDLEALLAALAARGLHAILVEGGGMTVSAFLAAGLVDRLHLAVAPLLLGPGRPGVTVPAVARLGDALRPPCRTCQMGPDVLFDCDLAAWRSTASTTAPGSEPASTTRP